MSSSPIHPKATVKFRNPTAVPLVLLNVRQTLASIGNTGLLIFEEQGGHNQVLEFPLDVIDHVVLEKSSVAQVLAGPSAVNGRN